MKLKLMARAESLAEELRSTQAALQAVLAEMAAIDGAPPAPAVAKIVVGGGGRQRQQRRTMQQVKRGVLSWAQVAERQWQRMEARTILAEQAAARVREAQRLAEAAHAGARTPMPREPQHYVPGPGPPWR